MPSEPPNDPIRDFIDSQRGRFANRDNNRFALGFGKILRYQKFLALILQRHMPDAEEFRTDMMGVTEMVVGTPPLFMPEDLIQRQILTDRIHLDIESFYLFAKILLDWVARSIEFYFGQCRSASLDSHDKLAKNIDAFAKEKGLSGVPVPLMDAIKRLKTDIADYRDYQIAHDKKFRGVQGTSCLASGPVMGLGYVIEFRRGDRLDIFTIPLLDLAGHVVEYLAQVCQYLRANEGRTQFEIGKKV